MSIIVRAIKIVIFFVLFFITVLIAPFSNDVQFTEFDIPSKPTYPEGENVLNNAERLYEGFIRGPECFSIYKDELYISAHGGWIYKLNQDQIVKYIKLGKDCNEEWWEEAECGRPLGIQFDSAGILYIADAYNGIFMANLSTGLYDGHLKQLVSLDDPIKGKAPRLPNSLDISRDGSIYWTDSSTVNGLHNGLMTLLADGDGRLLKLNVTSGENTVLMENLAFANGVVLSGDESFILVAESGRSRVQKYYLKGTKAGTSEIFLDNLPGYPDNIHLSKDGDIVVSLMSPFEPGRNILARLGFYPSIRKFAYKSLKLIDAILNYLNKLLPNYIFTYMEHMIGHLESIHFISDKRVKILFVGVNGQIKKIISNNDGKVSHISDFIEYKDYYYLGSPYNNYVGRLKKTSGDL